MNIGIIILSVLAGLWALSIFFGFIGTLTKPFSHIPNSTDSSVMQAKEEQTIEDTKDKQQKMMDDIRQKMEDSSQRN